MSKIEEIKRLLSICSKEQRREIFRLLREEFPIHPIEAKYKAEAEVILEAIDRASDLTQRGVKGIIAEAVFATDVVGILTGWEDITPPGDLSYDFLLRDQVGEVRVQIKMQRKRQGRPMMANEATGLSSPDMYVVETQRTRGGIDPATGQSTRPYRFNEFDVLAVSMQPSTNNWNTFRYTVSNWLIPRADNPSLLQVYQPVAAIPNDDWSDNFITVVEWFRSQQSKRVRS
jgi:hypothetical protein